jgi:hypothetical protein
LAAAVGRAPLRSWLVGFAPLIFWFARDAALLPTATFQLKTTSEGRALDGGLMTSIAFHALEGAVGLGRALAQDGLTTIVLFAAAFAGIALAQTRVLRVALACALTVFLFQPLGFTHISEAFGTDTSLRYGLPFLVVGALVLAPLARRAPRTCFIIALLCALYGAYRVVNVFANDQMTRGTWWVILMVAFVVLVTPSRFRPGAGSLLAMGIAAYTVVLAGSHPAGYYDDWLDGSSRQTQLFEWIAHNEPSAVVGSHFRVGAINVVSPGTRVADALADEPCEEALRLHALLVLANEDPGTNATWERDRTRASVCGVTVYSDPWSVVVEPR